MPLVLTARAVLFDMDGTLVDSGAVISRVLRAWGDRHGIDRGKIDRLPHGQRTSDTIAGLAPHLDLVNEVESLDAAELADLEGIVEIAGAAALLVLLHEAPWAVVTSADRTLARLRIRAAGLPLPHLLISGESVVRGKPSPEGYLLAAEGLECRPEDCVVFEDAPAGIAAAVAAGMRVIGVATTSPVEALIGCAHIVPDLSGVSVNVEDSLITLSIA